MRFLTPAFVILTAYGLGCFTTAYYWVRWKTGRDIRRQASGNAGARNAGRLLGSAAFVVVFLCDVAKGALAVGLARWTGLCDYATMATLLAVLCGHVWPVQLGFRGGKGLSAALGGMLVYDPAVALVQIIATGLGTALTRRSVWGLLLGLGIGPVAAMLWDRNPVQIAGVILVGVFLAGTHRENLSRERGDCVQENPVGARPPEGPP